MQGAGRPQRRPSQLPSTRRQLLQAELQEDFAVAQQELRDLSHRRRLASEVEQDAAVARAEQARLWRRQRRFQGGTSAGGWLSQAWADSLHEEVGGRLPAILECSDHRYATAGGVVHSPVRPEQQSGQEGQQAASTRCALHGSPPSGIRHCRRDAPAANGAVNHNCL